MGRHRGGVKNRIMTLEGFTKLLIIAMDEMITSDKTILQAVKSSKKPAKLANHRLNRFAKGSAPPGGSMLKAAEN